MPATYEPIATTTLGSTTASYTFSSIPGTYTDLILVGIARNGVSGDNFVYNINGATSGYSGTRFIGNGSTVTSSRTSSFPVALAGNIGTEWTSFITHFMNYSNTTTNKTFITRCNNTASETQMAVNLYQSTSAMTSIKLSMSDQSFVSGTTFTLYGILAA